MSSALRLLETRRSCKPRDMIAPGPDAEQLRAILKIAMRVPDHGKLTPWRFVIIGHDQRVAFADLLKCALATEKPDASQAEYDAAVQFAHQAAVLVVVLSATWPDHKIPAWEQELSVGAACMNALLAAHAQGYVGCWLTGWPAYSQTVREAFGDGTARIAGFLFFGTAGRIPEERPRPEPSALISDWG